MFHSGTNPMTADKSPPLPDSVVVRSIEARNAWLEAHTGDAVGGMRAALAALTDGAEPVAWIYEERYGHNDDAWIERIGRALPVWEYRNAQPLYTAPRPSAALVGL